MTNNLVYFYKNKSKQCAQLSDKKTKNKMLTFMTPACSCAFQPCLKIIRLRQKCHKDTTNKLKTQALITIRGSTQVGSGLTSKYETMVKAGNPT